MPTRAPQIVALGGGGFSMEKEGSLLDDYVLSLLERPTAGVLPADRLGRRRPLRGALLPPLLAGCEASHVSLFRRDQGTGGVEDDLATHLLAQDLIYVGGGNVVSMLGAWRAHGLDAILRKAWRKGIVLCGPSAGSLCWFEQALSAFHGAPRPIRGAGPAALLQLRPLRRRAGAPRGVPPRRRRGDVRRASPSRTASRCTSAARAWSASSARGRTAAPTCVELTGGEVLESRSRSTTSVRRQARLRAAPRAGAGRRLTRMRRAACALGRVPA